jgi:hypothetical protein
MTVAAVMNRDITAKKNVEAILRCLRTDSDAAAAQ